MRNRAGFFPGLLALLAMTFSLAETVWSSTCAGEMEPPVVTAHQFAAVGGAEAMPGMPNGAGEHEGDDADCPFAPITSGGCAAAASLPATAAEAPSQFDAAAANPFQHEAQQDLFSGTPFFHPPRA